MKITIRLMAFLKKQRGMWILAFLCIAASTIFTLIIPKMLGLGIDTVLTSGQRSAIFIAAGVIIGSSALRGLTGYGNRFFTEVISQRIAYDIRDVFYNHLQGLSFAYFDKSQTGQLMSRATVDIEAVRTFISQGLLQLLQTLLMMVGIIYLLISLDWRLALISLAFVPIIVWRVINVEPQSAANLAKSATTNSCPGYYVAGKFNWNQSSEEFCARKGRKSKFFR